MKRRQLQRPAACALAVLFAVAACATHTKTTYVPVPASAVRDWAAHPATLDLPAPSAIYAVSDPHGGYDRLAALLAASHVIAAFPPSPEAPAWAAGDALLVVAGDLVDKGPQPLEVIDFLRALEDGATAAGGRVVVVMGNHEAEFFVDPGNSKADGSDGLDHELRARGIDPVSVASGADAHGQWLRERPLAVRAGSWFFAHAGDTHGRSLAALDAALRAAIDAHADYDDPELVGDDSLLESRGWYADSAVAPRNASALGVAHVVFGHDPHALGPRGAIAVAQGGALFRIDCGMSPDVNDSSGEVLRVRGVGASEVAEAIDARGNVREVWRAAP